MSDYSAAYRLQKRSILERIQAPKAPTDYQARRVRRFIVGLSLLGSFFFLVAIGLMGQWLGLSMLTGLALIALVVWRKPWWGVIALVTFTPMHTFLMMLVYQIGDSGALLRLAQIWKEGVLVILLLKAIHLAFEKRRPVRMTFLDLAIVLYAFMTILYIFAPVSDEPTTPTQRIFGARTDMSFLLPVFLARGLSLNQRQVRIILSLVIGVSILVGVIAFFQVAAPGLTNEVFDQLGYSKYIEFQKGDAGGAFAVRQREVTGLRLTRAASLLMGDLALAFYQLLMVPLAMALFLTMPGRKAKILGNLFLAIMLATMAVTVTRSAILAALAVCAILVIWRRRVALGGLLLTQSVLLFLGVAALMNLSLERITDLFSLQESSSQGHLRAWEAGWEVLQRTPWGNGLGTTGTISQRFNNLGGFTPESWYFQIAIEMGVFQALLFIAISGLFFIVALKRYRQVQTPLLRSLCLGMAGAVAGYSIVGLFLHVWEVLAPAMLFWFLAGIVLAAPEIERAALLPQERAS